MSEKPRVAILTSLVDYSPAYSLVGIILDQARMLKRHGYDYDLLCLKSFNQKEWGAEKVNEELSVRYVLPQTFLHDYQPGDPAKEPYKDENGTLIQGFEQQVGTHLYGDKEKGWLGYKEVLKDYDVIIDHDLMFLSWHLPQNAALRQCIDTWPEKTWIHWVHSGPSVKPEGCCYPSELRFSAAPHSTYVYLNHRQKHDYALMINTPDKNVSVVYNPKDIRDVYEFDDLTCDMIDRYNLLDHEILQVYPFSTPRWRDKGVKQLMKIFGFWRRDGINAKLVLVNAHCNSPKDVGDLDGMEAYAESCGLKMDEDLILTSRYADEVESDKDFRQRRLRYTVPFRTVREMVCASNLFIFPSISECCSLIQAEASMAGKYMVLNRDFQPMLEFCSENVLHFEFTKNNPDANPVYYEAVAREVLANIRAEPSIVNRTQAITRTYNRDWIFKHQLEPLLYIGAADNMVRCEDPVAKRREAARRRSAQPTQPRGRGISVEEPSGATVPVEQAIVDVVDDDPTKTTTTQPPHLVQHGKDRPDYENPQPGMECGIYGKCSERQMKICYDQAGHCLMLDEIDHEGSKAEKTK